MSLKIPHMHIILMHCWKEHTFDRIFTSDEMNIDAESYEEIRTIAMELGDDVISPEG